MNARYCFRCWAHGRKTPAVLTLDQEDLCGACAQAEYSPDEIAIAKRIPNAIPPAPAKSQQGGRGKTATELEASPARADAVPVDVNNRSQRNGAMEPRVSAPPENVCKAPQCEKVLNANNRSGYCSKHFYLSLKKDPEQDGRRRRRPRVTTAARRTIAKAVRSPQRLPRLAAHARKYNGHDRVDIPSVPVGYLDEWWSKLEPANKGEAFSAWLQAAH